MKKVYFPLIAFGGMCRGEFSLACSALFVKAVKERADLSLTSTGLFFESLISRGRNAAAAAALHYNCDYLLFIDSDITFDPADVFKLLDHDREVVCGPYVKKYLNKQKVKFLSQQQAHLLRDDSWKEVVTDFSTELSPTSIKEVCDGNNLISVDYAATGFMLIKTSVFKKIAEKRPELKYKNEVDGYMSWGDNFYDFFPAQINPKTKKYESEDYGFLQFVALFRRGNPC